MKGIYLWVENDGAGDVITNPYRDLDSMIEQEIVDSWQLDRYKEKNPTFVFDKSNYQTEQALEDFLYDLYENDDWGIPVIRWIDLENMTIV